MYDIESEKDTSTFGSGMTWFITCVFVTASPTVSSCIFQSISEYHVFKFSIFFYEYLIKHLKDIVLISVSISCSLLALSIDKTKIIRKRLRRVGIITSGLAGFLSFSYYFFLDGLGNSNDENDFGMMIFYIGLIIICSSLGCIIGHRHDKNIKK